MQQTELRNPKNDRVRIEIRGNAFEKRRKRTKGFRERESTEEGIKKKKKNWKKKSRKK